MNREKVLEFFKKESKEVAKITMKYFKKLENHHIQNKSADFNDPVTIADLEISKYIIKRVKEEFGDSISLLSEESCKNFVLKEGKPIIVIDELDGTVNFKEGNESFCHLFAFCEKENDGKYYPTVSLTYAPILDLTCHATKNKGSFCNGKEIHVSKNKLFNTNTSSWFSFRDYWPKEYIEKNSLIFNITKSSFKKSKNLFKKNNRNIGLKLPHLAKGDIDVYIHSRCANWDYASASLIIEEAGGSCYVVRNKEDLLNPRRWHLQLDNPGEYYPSIFTNGAIDESFFEYIKNI